jgi:hypothetical protein
MAYYSKVINLVNIVAHCVNSVKETCFWGRRDSDAGLGAEHRGRNSLSTLMKALLEAGLWGRQSLVRETGHYSCSWVWLPSTE